MGWLDSITNGIGSVLGDVSSGVGNIVNGVTGGSIGGAGALGGLLQGGASILAGQQGQQGVNAANQRLNPFYNLGTSAANSLSNLAGFNGANPQAALNNLPGYQFTLNQGLKSVQNSAAARGLGVSGAALKGAAGYATGLANQTYGDQFSRLEGLVNSGQNAAVGQGNNLITGAQGIGQSYLGAANGANNALASGASNPLVQAILSKYGYGGANNAGSSWTNPDNATFGSGSGLPSGLSFDSSGNLISSGADDAGFANAGATASGLNIGNIGSSLGSSLPSWLTDAASVFSLFG